MEEAAEQAAHPAAGPQVPQAGQPARLEQLPALARARGQQEEQQAQIRALEAVRPADREAPPPGLQIRVPLQIRVRFWAARTLVQPNRPARRLRYPQIRVRPQTRVRFWEARTSATGSASPVPPNPSTPTNPSSVLGSPSYGSSQSAGSAGTPTGPTNPSSTPNPSSALGEVSNSGSSQSVGSANNLTGPTSPYPAGGSAIGSNNGARSSGCGSAIAATGTPQIMTGQTGGTNQTSSGAGSNC